jgi:hypothetical protein
VISGFFASKQKPQNEVKKVEPQKKVDANSFIYYKNQRELTLYKESLNKTDVQIIKSIFTFQFSKIKRLLLKKRLLVQNITIIDNRMNNRNISYTKVVRGFSYYTDAIVKGIHEFSNILTYALFLFFITYQCIQILSYF